MAKKKLFTATGLMVGVVVLLVLMQFIRIDKTNPPVNPSEEFAALANPPQDVALILQESCYDCHSNTTTYPWYADVAPASWFLKSHIDEGRSHLNFSVWGTYTEKKANHKLEESIEMVEEGEMPMTSYTLLRPEGKLTKEEKEKLLNWFRSIKKG
ncbi:heme-binding domain-containing protein [Pontibacter anaerobius]|uniref:Heme-binding domain-containing protein n=1 Tax=Pontibacter anaerobius TaxID=2993940 RepID=A0ABT3REJ1_9BACT|nr:heme-binding domain-containing protein [Pontibacter anaerobius]MCX2740267.1 heme-binding domain-containing protein [Pontibacter anaerobius]